MTMADHFAYGLDGEKTALLIFEWKGWDGCLISLNIIVESCFDTYDTGVGVPDCWHFMSATMDTDENVAITVDLMPVQLPR